MKDILHESKWCCVDQEGGTETAEVVEMLDGMHWEASERLNVCVSVVEAVDVFVHGGDVDKSEIKHFVSRKMEQWTCVQSRSGTLGRGAPRRQQVGT